MRATDIDDNVGVCQYAHMPRRAKRVGRTARTSVVLPHDIWLRASHQALIEGSNLRALIIEGLRLVLAKRKGQR
jgi:hypothetical protein